MKFHYKLLKSQADPNLYIAELLEFNIIISGDSLEEIDIEMKNAIDGWLQAFGEKELKDMIKFNVRELDYDIDERKRRLK